MNRPFSPAVAAWVAVPLLAAAVVLPAGLDGPVRALLAGGAPLAWAGLVAIATRTDPRGLAAALTTALPFTAYALAAFAPGPAAPWLVALALSAASASAVAAALAQTRAPVRLRIAAALILGASPGLALATLSSPWSGAAVSALVASIAVLVLVRRRR